jgi:hypothetical protein
MVTPETSEGGMVTLRIRSVEMPDSAALRSRAQDILPDVFDLDKSGVISEARMQEVLRYMTDNEGAKTVNFPTIGTRPGMACTLETGATEPGGRFTGITYALRADFIQDEEGYDLSVDYHRSGTRSED